jgi:two-component system, cell cycle sensor histidine kinase and response regulator CckA
VEDQHRLWAIVYGSPIPQFVLGEDHAIISWNGALEKYTGISAESVIGTNQHWRAFYSVQRPCLADLIIDQDLENIPRWYAGNYSKSDLVEGAYEATDFFPEMGEHGKWLHFTAAAIRDPEGRIIGAVETLEDITERKLAEEEARAARQHLLDMIDFLPDATFVVDQHKKVIAWNRAIEEMTGVHKEEIIGHGDYAYALPFCGQREPMLIDLLGTEQSVFRFKYDNFSSKGNTLYGERFFPAVFGGRGAYLWGTASPLLDSGGTQVGAIESLRDLTDHKRASEDLLYMQEQLRQAAKMEAVGRLAGGIAHDFNNQLTIVLGYCNLLLEKLPRESPDRKLVREILKAAERSAKLTGQLLAFGRKQVLNPQVLDVHKVLADLLDPLRRMIREDIHVNIQVAPELWQVEADRNQLEQAIINLAINARDAMPGGGRLTIQARNAILDGKYVLRHMGASGGPHVCLSVSDTGTGIDAATQQRIFEPFFTTKPMGEGTGLGLAMVYGFVKQSGGHMDVISEAGQGACFNIYFPQSAGVSVTEELVPKSAPSTGNETILVIEDEEALRELVASILKSRGYHVLQAADGQSAIALNRQYASPIDLVVCDVIMPGMSGPDVVKQVRSDRPGLRVLYVTGYAESEVLDYGGKECATRILLKPYTPDTLFRVVRKMLDDGIKLCA